MVAAAERQRAGVFTVLREGACTSRQGAAARRHGAASGRCRWNFSEAYYYEPLALDVAQRALARFTAVVEKAVEAKSAGLPQQMAVLNQIASAELSLRAASRVDFYGSTLSRLCYFI